MYTLVGIRESNTNRVSYLQRNYSRVDLVWTRGDKIWKDDFRKREITPGGSRIFKFFFSFRWLLSIVVLHQVFPEVPYPDPRVIESDLFWTSFFPHSIRRLSPRQPPFHQWSILVSLPRRDVRMCLTDRQVIVFCSPAFTSLLSIFSFRSVNVMSILW